MASLIASPPLMNQAISQQKSTPDLNDLTYYNNRSYGGISPEEINSTRAQDMLTSLHQYDPNAMFNPTYTSDGNLLGYQLQYDPSKLPGATPNMNTLGGPNPYGAGSSGGYASGSSFMPNFSTVQPHMNLANPNAVFNSDHYGRITPNKNIYDKTSLLDILGPLAVGAFGGFLSGFGGLPSFLQKAPGMLNSLTHGQFNPMQAIMMGAPLIPGMNHVMPYLNLMRLGANLGGR